MGMFDSVIVKCPMCEEDIEFQSKAGECCLITYSEDKVPQCIAEDLIGESEYCLSCGDKVTLLGIGEKSVALNVGICQPMIKDPICKITDGYVIQRFDPETKKCIQQEFVSSDEPSWDIPEGIKINTSVLEWHDFDMVQPEAK